MIGRTAELERIVGQVDAMVARTHRSNVMFVTGEAGMGKTTMLRAVEERLVRRGGHDGPLVVSTECSTPLLGQDVGQVEALEPWAELLEHILKHDGQKMSGAEMTKLLGSVAVAWCHCIPVVGGVIGSSIETAMLVKEANAKKGEKATSQEQMFQQYINFLAKASETHPLVLMLDDFHWADTSSTNLLFAAARHLSSKRVLFIIAYRADDAASSRDGEGHPLIHVRNELGRYSLYTDVVVPRLTAQDLDGLLRARYSNYHENDHFERWLAERSGGNALFITQYLQTLEEDGIVSPQTGEFKARFDSVRVPTSAFSVVEERIRRLDDEARELLRYASVEGATFTVNVLSALAGMPRLKLLQRLRLIAEKHEVIKSLGKQRIYASESTTFQFGNTLMQRALYESLEDEERDELHARVYASIKEDWETAVDAASSIVGLAVRLAAHAARPEDRYFAAQLLLEAARVSWARCAEEETLSVLDALAEELKALEAAQVLHGKPDKLAVRALDAETRLLTGLVHKFRGRHAQAIESFDAARARFEAMGDEKRALEALMRHAFTLENAHRYEEAVSLSQQVLARAQAAGDDRVRAAMLNNLGLALTALGRTAEGLAHQRESLALREKMTDRVGQAVSLGSIGLALSSTGQVDEALAHHRRALALREELGDRVGQGYSLANLGNLLEAGGRLDEALAYHRRSVEVREACADIVRTVESLDNEARVLLKLGRPADAITRVEAALRKRETLSDRRAEAASLLRLGQLVGAEGDAARSRPLLERARRLADDLGAAELARQVRDELAKLPPTVYEPAAASADAAAAEPRFGNGGAPAAAAPAGVADDALSWLVQAALWLHQKVENRFGSS
jgi:predicted ATPase